MANHSIISFLGAKDEEGESKTIEVATDVFGAGAEFVPGPAGGVSSPGQLSQSQGVTTGGFESSGGNSGDFHPLLRSGFQLKDVACFKLSGV